MMFVQGLHGFHGGLFFSDPFMLGIGLLSESAALWLVNRPNPYVLAAVSVVGHLMGFLGFSSLPMVETGFRPSLQISRGDFSILFGDPMSAVLLGIAFTFLTVSVYRMIRDRAKIA
jgi:putative tricarboxylic transport membrane protein